MDTPSHLIALATKLVRTCSCNWTADERQLLTEYLVSQLPLVPTDLALRVEAVGTTYRLVPR